MRKPGKRELDARDALAIREMTASRGWLLVRERIERTIERKRVDLERSQPELETARIRGELEGLRTVLVIPVAVEREAKAPAAADPSEREV